MASFEEYSTRGAQDAISSLPKHPFKRFQGTLDKFINIALPTDLERLHRHQINMEKFYKSESWRELTVEQINAARTVQQLKANISQMETTRRQVLPSEVHLFDDKVAPIKQEALTAVRSFREVQRLYSQRTRLMEPNEHGSDQKGAGELEGDMPQLNTDQQQQLLMDESAVESWDTLKDSLQELNELIHDFASIVHDQQSTLDSITDNIDNAQVSVHQGTIELGKASKLKVAMYPIMGAIVGGVAGGPVGLVLGLKVGAAVAVGGGVAGFFGGQYLKKHRQEATDIALQTLSSDKQMIKKKL